MLIMLIMLIMDNYTYFGIYTDYTYYGNYAYYADYFVNSGLYRLESCGSRVAEQAYSHRPGTWLAESP
jgi:hypothetical protein